MALNIGLLYLSLHNQLRKTVGINRIITRKDFFTILGKHFLIPKNIRTCIVQEMVLMNLIEKIDRDTIKVLHSDLDIETDANKFYQTLKLFE
jgi:uncharacterized protein YbcI